jgi:hypothetical protein
MSDDAPVEWGVFICNHIFDARHPCLLVVVSEGDWQFLCGGTDHAAADCHVVGANHILERDPTLREVLDLTEGWEAERSSVGAPWIRRRSPKE